MGNTPDEYTAAVPFAASTWPESCGGRYSRPRHQDTFTKGFTSAPEVVSPREPHPQQHRSPEHIGSKNIGSQEHRPRRKLVSTVFVPALNGPDSLVRTAKDNRITSGRTFWIESNGNNYRMADCKS